MNQAALFSENNALSRNDVQYLLDNYMKLMKWRRNDKILDVGCGPGDVTVELLLPRLPEDFQSLTGVDISAEMVSYANEHHKCDNRLNYQYLDIGSKNISQRAEFNHIFSFYCLNWVEDLGVAMENMYKMLLPGGDILLNFVARGPIFNVYHEMAKDLKWKDYMMHAHINQEPFPNCLSPEKELKTVLEKAGFQTPLCEIHSRSFTYPNLDMFRKVMISVNAYYSSIPKDLQDEYMDCFLTKMKQCAEIIEDNGVISVKIFYELFVVYAAKEEM